MESLWGEDFELKKEDEEKILNKVKKPKEVKVKTTDQLIKSKTVSIEEKIRLITEDVYKTLGSFKDETIVIKTYNDFVSYIDKAIENGIIAIDTETNNTVNTFDCKLMGLCIYTPGLKNAYVPVNHINRETGEKLSWQMTEAQICEQLQRLLDNNVFEVYHNAVFDIEVLKTTCNVRLHANWDTMVGAQLLNENELKGLKMQYKLHVNSDAQKYDIEHLFGSLPYEIFDPELFALYAATDSKITMDLYCYQRNEFEKPGMEDVYNLFKTVEIPILDVVVDMELTGVEVDLEYAKKMSSIYHAKSDEIQSRIDKELLKLNAQIEAWKQTPEANVHPASKNAKGVGKSKVEQLSDPIDLGSPTQMAILLYDILQAPVVDKMKPRTTDAASLEIFANEKHIKICELLLEKREVDILINTFIDAIPTFVQKDGRIHARFNTTGTQTGRFSSSSPNLQQIPSHAKDIRMMFKGGKGYSIVGSDYSAQEPRSTASLANDKAMLNAYNEGKDLYAVIGAACMHVPYSQCLEFGPKLVNCESHIDEVECIDNKFTFLSTDIINGVSVLNIKIDDILQTDEGDVTVNKIEQDLPYVYIYIKK